MVADTGVTWTARVRLSKLGETACAMPTLRKCTVLLDLAKKELCLSFDNRNLTAKRFLLSSITLPYNPPARQTITLLTEGNEAQEISFEFSNKLTMMEFYKAVHTVVPGRAEKASTTKSRGLYQNRTNVSVAASRFPAQKTSVTSTTPKGPDPSWSHVPEMEETFCSTPNRTGQNGVCKQMLGSRSTGRRSRGRPIRESLNESPATLARIYEKLSDENENPSLAAYKPNEFYGDDVSSKITNENTPRSAKLKRIAGRSLLKEIPMQKDAPLFPDVSPAQKSGSIRRRIQGVDDALLCQSPAKSPALSQQTLPPSPRKESPAIRGGFANLGNTCYMNAILQAICGVDEFSKELYRITSRVKTRNLIKENEVAMMSALSDLTSRRLKASHDEQRQLLQKVKSAVKTDAMRFSGYHQEDAQEFLSQVLDQVKDESDVVLKKVVDFDNDLIGMLSNPVTANFSFTLRHEIKCESCGHVAHRSEDANDLPMHLPGEEENRWNFDADIFCSVQTLLDDCLKPEKVEWRCEKCGSNSSEISHKFEKLPRCIIVYFKRYSFDAVSAQGSKRKDSVGIPLFLTLNGHCFDETLHYTAVPPSVKKISFSQVSVSEMKETPSKKPPAKRRLTSDASIEDEILSNTPPSSPCASAVNPKPDEVSSLNQETKFSGASTDLAGKSPEPVDPSSGRKINLPLLLCSPRPTPEKDEQKAESLADTERGSTSARNGKRRRSVCDSTGDGLDTPPISLDGDEQSSERNSRSALRTYTVDELNNMSLDEQMSLVLERSMIEKGRLGGSDVGNNGDCVQDQISSCFSGDAAPILQPKTIVENVVKDEMDSFFGGFLEMAESSMIERTEPNSSDVSLVEDCSPQSKIPRLDSNVADEGAPTLERQFVLDNDMIREAMIIDEDIFNVDLNGNINADSTTDGNDASIANDPLAPTEDDVFEDDMVTENFAPVSSQFVTDRQRKASVAEDIIGNLDDSIVAQIAPEDVEETGIEDVVKDSQNTSKGDELSPISLEAKMDRKRVQTLMYKPVGLQWRIEACKKLGIKVCKKDESPFEENPVEKQISLLDSPLRCGTVDADGNCLFRALAYYITGGKDAEYATLREKVVDFEEEFSDTFKPLKGLDEDEWSAHLEKMRKDTCWGTDLEIVACATILDIEVWTFLENAWYCYRPRFRFDQFGNRIDLSAKEYRFGQAYALYLTNQDLHFSPVLEVSESNFLAEQVQRARISSIIENADKGEMVPSYRLLSVVSHLGGTSNSGHYVCDVWSRKDDRWLHCDDDSISEVSEEKVRQQRATTGYIFFYIAAELLGEKASDRQN